MEMLKMDVWAIGLFGLVANLEKETVSQTKSE